jgi:bacterioferritin (cytochrome b1)
MAKKTSVDELNKLLRGELSAVQTYDMAIKKLEDNSEATAELEANLGSHQNRVMMLREQIALLGGEATTKAGAWGAFAKTVEGAAKIFGDKATVAALEEGEDHGLSEYKRELEDIDLDPNSRTILATHLLPAQEQTHTRVSMLKKRL